MKLAQSGLQRVEWRCSKQDYRRYTDLLEQLGFADEGTDHYSDLVDQLNSLPGWPYWAGQQPDRYYIVPYVVTVN